jgi:hypothetical protein
MHPRGKGVSAESIVLFLPVSLDVVYFRMVFSSFFYPDWPEISRYFLTERDISRENSELYFLVQKADIHCS